MILDNPALVLNIRMQDILDILESTLKERNWQHFDVANLKLSYLPYYIFNYDVLVEQKAGEQTYSQGFSGTMAMSAVDGKLEPLLTQIMEQQPVDYEKKVSHDLKYELNPPALKPDEAKQTAILKLAAKFGTGKDSIAVTGFRLVYWPVWKVFVTLPNKHIQRILVEGVSGYPLNIEEVPERELTWMEVTQETLEKLRTPKGWAELSGKLLNLTASAAKSAAGKKQKGFVSELVHWLLHTKLGRWTLLGIAVIILIILFF